MTETEDLLGWCVLVFFLGTLIYIIWRGIVDRSIFSRASLLALPAVLAFIWFLLWVLTGMVPYGLWAFCGALVYIILILAFESLWKKRSRSKG